MDSLIKIMTKSNKFNDYLKDIKDKKFPLSLTGLTDVAKVHMSYATSFYLNKPFIIITYNEIQAKKLIKDLQYFNSNVLSFPKKEILTYDVEAESKQISNIRLNALNSILKGENPIIVTTIEAINQRIIAKQDLSKDVFEINLNSDYDLEDIKQKLVNLGFERTDLVEGKGQFSVRGGIIDIAQNVKNIINEDIEAIKNGNYHNKAQKYFDSFYANSSQTLLDYLNDEYLIFIDEAYRVKQRIESILEENSITIELLTEKEKVVPDGYINTLEYEDYLENIKNRNVIYLERLDNNYIDKQNMLAKRNGYSFSCREVNFFRSGMDLFVQEIQKASKQNKTIVVLAGNEANSKKILKVLMENDIPSRFYQEEIGKEMAQAVANVTTGVLSSGISYDDMNLLIISSEELFNLIKKRKYKSQSFKNGEKIIVSDLNVGDYIVHQTHGIGQYIGINTLEVDKIKKDYIKLKYRNDDILYIPTDQLDNIRKYVGSSDNAPKLNKMGGKEWEKTKAKVKESLKDIAKGLIELYAKRRAIQGFSFSKDTVWQKEFEESFPYVETDDQLRCIQEVKKDMESPTPMDRLLCGDVGYGKTEVAIRAAFKACMDSKQVAYLVPTTVLATQQYNSFKDRMNKFPVKVEVLNRFKTKKEQNEILKKLELGEIDIIVGTHRILSKDIKFKNLGLLIIDEEHRFGVEHKEVIKELKNNVDVLTMTATPIPRTLHMSIVGVRDMSVIYEPPESRLPVQTYVLEYDNEVIKEAITKELERQGQVFYLYNKVEGIIKKANDIAALVPEAKVAYAHGKMSGSELEEIMFDFIDKKIDVLICTTILESGIDIPNANTIIVEDADRLRSCPALSDKRKSWKSRQGSICVYNI